MRAKSFVIAFVTSMVLCPPTQAVTEPNLQSPPAATQAATGTTLTVTPTATAATPPAPVPANPIPGTPAAEQSNEEKPGPPSLFEDAHSGFNQNASVRVLLHTSRTKEAQDVFTLYPYPLAPPTWVPQGPLPTREKALRNMIRNTGYANRPNLDKPYVDGGFRWYYAYKAALQKSGISEPHTAIFEYRFCEDMLPYVARECKIRNDYEKGRIKRYNRAKFDWERTHADLEADAIRQGLMPIALTHREWSVGRGEFPAGTWWLQVTRKTPGVQYYWLQPIAAAPGQHFDLVLNDDNALAIIGGW